MLTIGTRSCHAESKYILNGYAHHTRMWLNADLTKHRSERNPRGLVAARLARLPFILGRYPSKQVGSLGSA